MAPHPAKSISQTTSTENVINNDALNSIEHQMVSYRSATTAKSLQNKITLGSVISFRHMEPT
jgi:hypothetical protein